MSDSTQQTEEAQPRRGGRLLLIISGVLALALGGGGFAAARSGLLSGLMTGTPEHGLSDLAFVPIPPLVITLGPESRARHLRFAADLEVKKGHEKEVAAVMPRILDVLNGYLRAVEIARLEDPPMLMAMRAQMLRRVQIVTGEGRVRDLLVSEFIVN